MIEVKVNGDEDVNGGGNTTIINNSSESSSENSSDYDDDIDRFVSIRKKAIEQLQTLRDFLNDSSTISSSNCRVGNDSSSSSSNNNSNSTM